MILCYHKVSPETPTVWWISPNAFYKHMLALQSRQVVRLAEYDPGNPSHVVITFDGIYENVREYALPILKHFAYPFELFVIGDHIGGTNEFDKVEPLCRFADFNTLDVLCANGGRVQWHTRTHRRMSEMTAEDAKRELIVPEEIRRRYPYPNLTHFAFPHGDFTGDQMDVVRGEFTGALACDDGDIKDRYRFPRTTVYPDTQLWRGSVVCIVANYNYGHFLREAIDSVERQIVPPDEVLVIDDASTDASDLVLDELEDAGYKVIRNEKNLGIVDNFKKAVSLTESDYVFILGADNKIRSDFVARCRIELDRGEEVAVAYTDALLFGPLARRQAEQVAGPLVGRSRSENWEIFEWKFPDANEETLARFERTNFAHGSSMYRRTWYERAGGYVDVRVSGVQGAEDYSLFRRIAKVGGKFAHVAEPVLEYRQHTTAQANTVLGFAIENRSLRRRIDLATKHPVAFLFGEYLRRQKRRRRDKKRKREAAARRHNAG